MLIFHFLFIISSTSGMSDQSSPSLTRRHSFLTFSKSNNILRRTKSSRSSSYEIPRSYSEFDVIANESIRFESNPYIQLLSQYCLLKQLFPDFPSTMLSNLLLREMGQSKIVANSLIEKGWIPDKSDRLSYLTEIPSDLFQCKYYWGKYTPSFLLELTKSSPGSYITALNENNQFIMCFINQNNECLVESVTSPKIANYQKQLYCLSNPLSRPSSIPILHLAPALLKPSRTFSPIQ